MHLEFCLTCVVPKGGEWISGLSAQGAWEVQAVLEEEAAILRHSAPGQVGQLEGEL